MRFKILIASVMAIFFWLASGSIAYADFYGSTSGVWIDPVPTGSSPVFSGVGTSKFEWGRGTPPNSLQFGGDSFDTLPETVFKLGTVTYYNGTTASGTGASAVTLAITLDIQFRARSIREITFLLELKSTPNNTGSEWDNADFVYFPNSLQEENFVFDSTNYKLEMIGFSRDGDETILKEFHVREDHETSADLYGWITAINSDATLTHIEISGSDRVILGDCALYTATAYYDDGSTRAVTEAATWTENCENADINSAGLLSLLPTTGIEECSVEASYQGKSQTLNVNLEFPDGNTQPTNCSLSSTLLFSSATYSVTENGGQATITVTRSGGRQDGQSSLNYATSDGTAIAGSDYSQTAGTLNWGNGDFDDKTFTIAITDDSLSEDNETFTVSLSDPVSGESLDNATVTITDNDSGQPGTPQFTSSTVNVAETASTVTLTVRRVGGTNGELTVNYATTSGTATDGSDYVGATGGTLTWADGDSSDKTLTVTISDDSDSEGPETFTVTLSDQSSGGSLDSATVSITDNDTTLVTLASFTATALENSIEIVWVTQTEFDSIGFHIWRATGEGWKYGDYSTVTRLTDQLIPAEGNSGAGATYSYMDYDVEPGLTYYYGLEDRNGVGQPTYYLDDIDSATAK
ncbi:MAG: Calx-beta domain-containing protein [Pseudomonadota bacterium]